MYFKFDRRYSLLQIEDSFARLTDVSASGDISFELTYSVSQKAAVKRNAVTVSVSVFSKQVIPAPIVEQKAGNIDTRKLLRNILTLVPRAKTAAVQQESFTVATKNSSIIANVNNEIIGQLRSSAPLASIPTLKRSSLQLVSVGQLKQNNIVKPILNVSALTLEHSSITAMTASVASTPIRIAHDMILRQGIDPSAVSQTTPRTISATNSIQGTLRPAVIPEIDFSPSSLLSNIHVSPGGFTTQPLSTVTVVDSQLVQVLVSQIADQISVPVKIVIPASKRSVDGKSSSSFFVKFDLIDNTTNIAIDTVTKSLDVARHLQLFYTPKIPPIVNTASSELSSRTTLEVKQLDPGATAVQIYKKRFFTAVPEVDEYDVVGTYSLTANQQTLLVQVDKPYTAPIIYRVIPVGAQGNQGFEYTNIVVSPARYSAIKSLALSAQSIDTGIQLEASNIPQRAVAIEFLVRNMTTFESDYTNFVGDVVFIDEASRTADHMLAVHKGVPPNNVYEYVAKIIYVDGSTELTGNCTIEFLQPEPGKVDTKISNLTVSQGITPNVSFTATTTVVDNNADIVKSLLQRQDIYDLFKDDVTKEREFLKSLIAHNVQRTDLTTGKREDFGIITDGLFDDVSIRKNLAVDALQTNHKYRYDVVALLRSPETMFENLSKEKTDAVTKKTFRFNPAKFMHPIALTQGTLMTSTGLKTRSSKDPMSHGTIGASTPIDVSFDGDPIKISDPLASRFDEYLNIVTWKVQGSLALVDHFIIMKEIDRNRTIIGKAHSEFIGGNCQFLHPLTQHDAGSLQYIIVPVFNDYQVGTSVTTNSLSVQVTQ